MHISECMTAQCLKKPGVTDLTGVGVTGRCAQPDMDAGIQIRITGKVHALSHCAISPALKKQNKNKLTKPLVFIFKL